MSKSFIRKFTGGPLDGRVEHLPATKKIKALLNKSTWIKGRSREDNIYLLEGEVRKPLPGEEVEYLYRRTISLWSKKSSRHSTSPAGDLPATHTSSKTKPTKPMSIPRNPVTSSQIASIGHDPATNRLHIEFKPFPPKKGATDEEKKAHAEKPNAIYEYDDVSPTQFEALTKAESVGKHFGANIKGKVPFRRIN